MARWKKATPAPAKKRNPRPAKRGRPRLPKPRLFNMHLEGDEYLPLQFFLTTMRNDKAPFEVRHRAAVAAAPYCHPALRSVDFKGSMTVGLSAALQQFMDRNAGSTRHFLDFDREGEDAEEAPGERPLHDN